MTGARLEYLGGWLLLVVLVVGGLALAQSAPSIPLGGSPPPGGAAGALDETAADLLYLRLDASNDPVIGPGRLLVGDAAGGALDVRPGAGVDQVFVAGSSGTAHFTVAAVSGVIETQFIDTDLCNAGDCEIFWTSAAGTAAGRVRISDADGLLVDDGLYFSTVSAAGDAHTFDTDNAISAGGTIWRVAEQGTERWHVDGDGHLAPAASATYDLGGNTANVRVVYATTVQSGSAGGADLIVADDLVPDGDENRDLGAPTFTWDVAHVSELQSGSAGGTDDIIVDDDLVWGADGTYNIGASTRDANIVYTENLQSGSAGGAGDVLLNDNLNPGADASYSLGELGGNAYDEANIETIVHGGAGGADNLELADTVVPDSDNARALGGNTLRWSNVNTATVRNGVTGGAALVVDDTINPGSDSLYNLGTNVTGTWNVLHADVWRAGRDNVGTAPPALPTCDASREGQLRYWDDTDDAKLGGVCACIRQGAGDGTLGWVALNGGNCA